MTHKIISIVLFATAAALFAVIYFLEFSIPPYWGLLAVILFVASLFAEHFSQEDGEDFEHLEERPDWFKHIDKWVGGAATIVLFIMIYTQDLTDDLYPWWGKAALFALLFVGGLNVFFQLKAIRRARSN